jgi:ABC-2 type transport system ATP-binding protein
MSTSVAIAESAARDASIAVEGVRHVYRGGTVALDGVDLRVGVGLFGLLGPNGAGKSTLMRIICTLLVPSSGRITVGGHDVLAERRSVRRLIGYLPQDFGGWRLQRVEEMLDTVAALSGMGDSQARRRRVVEVLESVGLEAVADRKVKKLSGGMVRRLGVAQALVHEPRVLVVDEPTVGLDPEERLRFRQLMVRLAADRVILLSTHIVADLGSGCHDMALIDAGKVVFRGAPADLVSKARGRVFELETALGQEPQLGDDAEIVSRVEKGSVVVVRAVTAGAIPHRAREVDPSLEEGYLAFMAARGRASAAVEGGE